MITFAQNFEDVMIARLFDANYRGFYIDIGAAHPDFLSVTRHFYDQGWSGINVEPTLRFFPLLSEARPRDINLNCAVGNTSGMALFYEVENFAENSTLDPEVAERLSGMELPAVPHEVEVVRLAEICERYAKSRTIDFMKIDVEGGELGVLQSADWNQFRPRLLIIEATMVNSREENWRTWEPIVIEAGYHKVWFDGLNNFYLRDEDKQLRDKFTLPPNVHDGFEGEELVRLRRSASELRELVSEAEQSNTQLSAEIARLRSECERTHSESARMRSERNALEEKISLLLSKRTMQILKRLPIWPELSHLQSLLESRRASDQ